jgi:hypothetical protein
MNVDEQKKAGVYCVNFPESEKVRIPQDEQTLVFVMNEKDWFIDSIRKCVKEAVKHQGVYIIINYKDKRLKYAAVNEDAFELIDKYIKDLINKDKEPSDTLEEIKPTIDEQIDSLEVDMSLVQNLEKEFGDISLSKVRKLLAKRYEHLCYEDLFPY